MKVLFLFVSFLLFTCPTLAQPANGSFFSKNTDAEKTLLQAIDARYKTDVGSLKSKNNKEIATIFKTRYQFVRASFEKNEIITDTKAASYLNALVHEIVKNNPALQPNELRVLFSRAWWPNASSMGEGTIFFNAGLFNRLRNEGQAVFVICHELAHYYLNHGNNSIYKYVDTMASQTVQKQLKTISKSEFQQNKQLDGLAKNLRFNSRRHSREFEHVADSMAIEFMKNTDYDLNEALQCLALLDSTDKDKYKTPLKLNSQFNFASYPFKKTWLQSSGSISFTAAPEDASKDEENLLKTHPDCAVRVQQVSQLVNKYRKLGGKKFIVDEVQFWQLSRQFDYEVLAYCFETESVSMCLYYALKMADVFPDDVYAHVMIGKCLNSFFRYQKNHELGKITDLPGPAYSDEYNSLLQLIQNARLTEFAALSYHYLQQFKDKFQQSPAFSAAWQESKVNFESN